GNVGAEPGRPLEDAGIRSGQQTHKQVRRPYDVPVRRARLRQSFPEYANGRFVQDLRAEAPAGQENVVHVIHLPRDGGRGRAIWLDYVAPRGVPQVGLGTKIASFPKKRDAGGVRVILYTVVAAPEIEPDKPGASDRSATKLRSLTLPARQLSLRASVIARVAPPRDHRDQQQDEPDHHDKPEHAARSVT